MMDDIISGDSNSGALSLRAGKGISSAVLAVGHYL